MKNIKRLEDLKELGNKCVIVNTNFFIYMYNVFVAGTYNSYIYDLFYKYISNQYMDDYISGYQHTTYLVNPLDLLELINYTGSAAFAINNTFITRRTLDDLNEILSDNKLRYNKKKMMEHGNVYKPVESAYRTNFDQSQQQLINNVLSSQSQQNKIDAALEANNVKKLVNNSNIK